MLIFTSNLGIFRTDPVTNQKEQLVKPGVSHEELERTVLAAIKEHFTLQLGRPELLNRFGDNIVVFDFIDAVTARRILAQQLGNVQDRLAREHEVDLRLGQDALLRLDGWCTSEETLSNGGRGIGSEVESRLINPLARYLFDKEIKRGTVTVDDISVANGVVTLHARHDR
jgi:ATP-dependent Clp protease ATP-binding subunit ClpB